MEESRRALFSQLNMQLTDFVMSKEILQNEGVLRLGCFLGIFTLMSLWE